MGERGGGWEEGRRGEEAEKEEEEEKGVGAAREGFFLREGFK